MNETAIAPADKLLAYRQLGRSIEAVVQIARISCNLVDEFLDLCCEHPTDNPLRQVMEGEYANQLLFIADHTAELAEELKKRFDAI